MKVKISLPRPHTLEVADWIKELSGTLNEYLAKPEVQAQIENEWRLWCMHFALTGEWPTHPNIQP